MPRLPRIAFSLNRQLKQVFREAQRLEQFHFLVTHRIGFHAHRRFHGRQAEHLKQVVLHHVPQNPGLFKV